MTEESNAQAGLGTFDGAKERLSQIVEEVESDDISLDDALKLYEEAIKLGSVVCDLSELDISSEDEDQASPIAEDAISSDTPVSEGQAEA